MKWGMKIYKHDECDVCREHRSESVNIPKEKTIDFHIINNFKCSIKNNFQC